MATMPIGLRDMFRSLQIAGHDVKIVASSDKCFSRPQSLFQLQILVYLRASYRLIGVRAVRYPGN